MANTLGPNDPCPCGSGRKYKKCCRGELDAAGPRVRESNREETEINSGILGFALEALGPEAVFAAWNEFHFGEPKETLDLTGPLNELSRPANR